MPPTRLLGGSPSRRRADRLAALALLVTALALHGRFLAGEALVGWDLTAPFAPYARATPVWNTALSDVPTAELAYTTLHAREGAAAWNPHTALGHAHGTFTPPPRHYPPAALLHALAPPWVAKGLSSLLHVVLGGLGMFGWLRWRGVGPRAALIGALAWQLAPLNTRWLEFSARTVLAGWAPLALWGAEATARSGSTRHAVLTAAALAAATLGGLNDQTGVLLYLVVGAVLVVRAPLRAAPLRSLGLAALALGLGALLAAARLLPMILELADGGRARIAWADYFDSTVRLGPRHLVLTLLPDALGSPLRGFGLLRVAGQRYANTHEVVLYVGLPVLALALAGVRRRAGTVGLALLAALLVVLAFPTPLAWPLWAFVPGFASSAPVRGLWAAQLLVPALAAAGAQAALGGGRRPLAVGAALGALVLGLAALVATPAGVEALLPPGLTDDPPRLARALARDVMAPGARGAVPNELPAWLPLQRVLGEGRGGVLLSPTLGPALLALGLVAALALAAARRPDRRRLGAALLVGLLTFELLHHGVVYNPTANPAALFPVTPGVARASDVARGGRVLLDRGFFPNLLLPAGVSEVGGYGSLLPGRVRRLCDALSGAHPLQQLLAPLRLPPPWRDALAVRAVLTAPDEAPTVPDGLERDHAGPDLVVWRNPGALPRARLFAPADVIVVADADAALAAVTRPGFDPRRQVVIEGPAPAPAPDAPAGRASLEVDEAERVVVQVDAPQGGVLLLADAWAPGWSAADADGRPLVAAPADVALRGVVLPAGHRGPVVWTYRTPGQAAGAALSLLALLAAALVLYTDRTRYQASPTTSRGSE